MRATWKVVGALLLVASVGCRSKPEPSRFEHEVKGWELYSIDEGDRWSFALLPGTNRLKTAMEVHAAAVDADQLLRNLARLPRGEFVAWCNVPERGRPGRALPPEVVSRVETLAADRGLELH